MSKSHSIRQGAIVILTIIMFPFTFVIELFKRIYPMIWAKFGHRKSLRKVQVWNTMCAYRKNINRLRKTDPEMFFKFKGQLCIVDPQLLAQIIGYTPIKGDFTVGFLGLSQVHGIIVVSQKPDFNNKEDMAALWHEVGHLRNKDQIALANYYIEHGKTAVLAECETRADELAARMTSPEIMAAYLEKGMEKIPAHLFHPTVIELNKQRIRKLRWMSV